jgi:tetratricopeptide (TPR) repeat protein
LGVAAAAYRAGWHNLSRWIRSGRSWSGHERNGAFQNLGGWAGGSGRFADVSFVQGLDMDQDGRVAVPVDWDMDGDQDLWIVSRNAPRLRLMVNQSPAAGDFIALRLHGVQANRGAIGARVEVLLDGGIRPVLVRSQRAGSGYLAQTGPWLHFGLGAGKVREVRVLWPGGEWESFGKPDRGQFWQLRQGTGRARLWTPPSLPDLDDGPAEALAGEDSALGSRLPLAVPTPMPRLEVTGLDGEAGEFLGITPGGAKGTGRPVLITLWSHTCAPCLLELTDLAAAAEVFDQVGLKSVLLCVDPPDELRAVQQALERTAAPGQAGWANAQSMGALDALASVAGSRPVPLPVPSSFLVDPGGRLQVIYRGRVRPQTVLQDLALIPLKPQARRMAALPFAGRFLLPVPEDNLAWWEGGLRRLGLGALAAEFALGQLDAEVVDEAQLHLGFGRARLQQGKLVEALQHFQKASSLNPQSRAAWLEMGVVQARLGHTDAAQDALLRALQMGPGDGRAHFEWGRILVGRRDGPGVEAQIRQLRAISSERADALALLWEQERKR